MSKVYFKPIDSYLKTGEISKSAGELLKKINEENKMLDFKERVPLKVHFGEAKNITYIESKNFEGIINYLKENKANAAYIETNVLYRGRRTTRESHLALAKEHGFTQLPIVIADGEMGEAYENVNIQDAKPKHFKECKIGKEIAQAKQLIVLAHFKGHMLAGFGGAIKQLSMGCAARGGKLAMHAQSKPLINPLQCKKCHTCLNNCPTEACIIDTLVPHIDYSLCIGCAKCIAVCPYGAVHVNWASTSPGEFVEKLAEHAYAAQKGKKVIYLNFVFNITKNCDCDGREQQTIAKDIGVLASTDPVALDKACLDLLRKNEKKQMFGGDHVLEHAEKIGLGSQKYELIEVK
ncbi:MAG: DUF362 domain-containing protein [archaeon]|jgi:hypothetical protein